MQKQQDFFINGIDANTGGPDLEGMTITAEMITKLARGQRIEPNVLRDTKMLRSQNNQMAESFGISEGIDDQNLSETGWGVVFPANLPQKSVDGLKDALKPLLELRKQQAAAHSEIYYREYIGPELGVQLNESKNEFLNRYGKGPGPAEPKKFPYYALIVASPETIDFSFQAQLDIQYAVGRIYFDTLEEYYQYAQSVVQAETMGISRGRKAAFWGPAHPEDGSTQISSRQLVQPLAQQAAQQHNDWMVNLIHPEESTKSKLAELMGGRETPSLLLTASHSPIFALNDSRLLAHQGALVCQDWPGPGARSPLPDSQYFSADDIAADADVFGMVAVLLSTYGASTPNTDGFYRQAFDSFKTTAPFAFLSRLPMKLLSHPRGGALGIFSYTDRYWGSSLNWEGALRQTEIFNTFLNSLMTGQTLGSALDIISAYYAEVSIELTEELESTNQENQDEHKIAGLWAGSNDNRNITFLGDPAAKLNLAVEETPHEKRAELGSRVSATPNLASIDFQPDVVERVPRGPDVNINYGIDNLFNTGAPEDEDINPLGVSVLADFSADVDSGKDRLMISPDVDAFSKVIASQTMKPPLCLGLFGDWGSGKSFFMNKMQDRINYLAQNAKNYEQAGNPTAYCSNVVQIKFNAWNYVDADLWASLISHIFDELASYIATEQRSAKQVELFKKLESAKQLQVDAQESATKAVSERTTAQKNLEQIQRNREEKSIDLKQLRMELFKTALDDKENVEVKEALDQFSKELGITNMVETAEDVQKVIQEFGSLRGRFQAVLLALTNAPDRWWRLLIFLIVLLLLPAIPAAINYLNGDSNFLTGLAASLTQITTFVAGLAFWLKGFLSKASKVINDLEKAKGKVDAIVKQSRKEPDKTELALMQEITGLQERETASRQLLLEAQQRVDQAQAEITALADIQDGRKLAQYVRDRITNEDYRKRLGIISLIRRDLQSLSDFLITQKQHRLAPGVTDVMPRIDRIVLYIDDLDRCPEERVVEVLQAIHLLLAFELFVVVVGVDSRWLLHSLEKAYPALNKEKSRGDGWMEEEKLAWETTPQNYIEKIFQIPFNLHLMDKSGYEKLIEGIIHPDPEEEKSKKEAAENKKADANSNAGQEMNLSVTGLGAASEVKEKIEPTQAIDEALLFGLEQPKYKESYGGVFDDQTPELLVIGPQEEAFIQQLYALVPTPRAAKRLVNIYRLIRAKLAVKDLTVFLGDGSSDGEFKAVLVLLAILTGFQREAPYVYRQINNAGDQSPWKDILESILPHRKSGSEQVDVYYNGILPTISKADTGTWRRMYFALREITKNGDIPAGIVLYKKWTQQVARFSFRLGKSFIYFELPADIKITYIDTGLESQADECVTIENFGDNEQELTGWRLLDQANHEYVFPSCVLAPRCQVRVWSKSGQNSSTDLFWGRKDSIWNNAGDNAYLYDKSNVLISNKRG